MNWKSIILWVLSFLLMAVIAVYQRTTGPTYPINADIPVEGKTVTIKLPTSADNDDDALISIPDTNWTLKGYYVFRKFKTDESWIKYGMHHEDDALVAKLPPQPAAGKLEYRVFIISDNGTESSITKDPVIIRFKNPVPDYFLIPHIILMFFAMVFSMRTGFEALFRRKKTLRMAGITLVLLGLGGLVFGPIVQYYAFGDFWTGWPFGKDLTDSKTLLAFIFWLIAWFRLKKNPENRFWPILASIVLLAIYLIPHSMFGSEFDYSSGEVQTGK